MLGWLGAFSTVAAQAPHVSISGRVLRGGRETAPLGNTWVVLHRITRDGGAPIDSVRSDARGRYRIELQRPDSTGVYVVSAWYDSLAYFSSPVNVDHPAAHADDIITYATTANAPPIKLARRLATIAHPGQDGTREILEILELENTGQTARITRDTLVPTWAGRVPERGGQFRGGQGDISPDAMLFRHDSVVVLAPIPPGPMKQLSYAYSLAADTRTFAIPIDQETTELNLLVEDTAAAVTAPKLERLGVQELEQRRFAAYRAGPLKAGDRVEIQLPAGKFRAQAVVPYLIGLLAAGMVVALVWALKKKPLAQPVTPS